VITGEDEARAFVAQRCASEAMVSLDALVASLRQENALQNLVSAASLDTVWTRHIADSAQLLDLAPDEVPVWLDLGTGAGFPGLVIAIMRPSTSVHLVESRRLRIDWLLKCVSEAQLDNVTVVGSRLEAAETIAAGVISARAFAPLERLLASARRFSTNDTVWLLPKGRSATQEVDRLPPTLRCMFHVEPSATDPAAGIVVGRIAKG